MIENRVIEVPEAREAEPSSTAQLLNSSSTVSGPDKSAPVVGTQHEALFPENERESFRSRWHDVQGSFVDEPKRAVEEADQLVAAVIKGLAKIFADERNKLEHEWSHGQDVSTEDLRQALRRYRSFFDRLLSV